MGKLQVYKIEFDDIRGVYKPGQDVTGRLILELEAGINVRGELNNAEISRGPGLDRALVLSCLSLGGGGFVPLEHFRSYGVPVKGCNFYLFSTLVAIEQ